MCGSRATRLVVCSNALSPVHQAQSLAPFVTCLLTRTLFWLHANDYDYEYDYEYDYDHTSRNACKLSKKKRLQICKNFGAEKEKSAERDGGGVMALGFA
jgi:hypothetical protein